MHGEVNRTFGWRRNKCGRDLKSAQEEAHV
jgi:hypothetical protein